MSTPLYYKTDYPPLEILSMVLSILSLIVGIGLAAVGSILPLFGLVFLLGFTLVPIILSGATYLITYFIKSATDNYDEKKVVSSITCASISLGCTLTGWVVQIMWFSNC